MQPTEVRVRFAPSPTGYLHVGGLRTALFNYLFAKSQNGKFVLRIEDTDRERIVEGSVENLIQSLHAANITFDEGPGKRGDYQPYVQSERLEIYSKYVTELLDNQKAYRCFCTSEELNAMRDEQKKRKMQTRYTGKCRKLSQEKIDERLAQNMPFVVRMKINYSTLDVSFDDIVRGKVVIKTSQLEDQIILKSDKYPTYHLANVVDDHLMNISHVIRGEEWLPSTPKHVLLYQAFGWETPKFVHLPLLLNPDRSKLSKRQGDVATEDFFKKGYLPEALVNFVALLGWNSGDEKEMYAMEELVSEFSLERISKANAVFDMQKLNWMNRHYISKLTDQDLIKRVTPFLKPEYVELSENDKLESISLARNGLIKLSDINEKLDFLYNDSLDFDNKALLDVIQPKPAQELFKAFISAAQPVSDWNEQTVMNLIKQLQKSTGLKGKNLWAPLRIAVSHEEHGPELPKLCAFLGKEKCIRRLKEAINE